MLANWQAKILLTDHRVKSRTFALFSFSSTRNSHCNV